MQARRDGVSSDAQTSGKHINACDVQNTQLSNKLETNSISNGNLLSLGNIIETNGPKFLPQSSPDPTNGSFGQTKPEAKNSSIGVGGLSFPNLSPPINPTLFVQPNEDRPNTGVKDVQEPQMPSLNISLCAPSENSNLGLICSGGIEEGDNSRSLFQPGQRPRQILPKPPKNNIAKVSDANKASFSPMRVARPPAEGRLRNQLLPRYWPRITDQELQKLSGEYPS